MTVRAGTRLGPYEITSSIGAGGMGEVYRARDMRLDRDVAVKVLPERFSGSPEALERFEREARAVAALAHPNILSLFDVGRADGTVYAVAELLEGATLRERLASERLPARKAVEVGAAVAEGLAAAHAKGIIHRDLKPENVFLTSDGRVKILDFGLARIVEAEAPADAGSTPTSSPTTPAPTEPGVVMGTAGYMSPEQVRGHPADARSDIFAFGTVLYEMLTGERAFARATAGESLAAILRDQPPEVSRTVAVSPALDRLVARCLEKNPDERFQSARDLAFALREAVSGSSQPEPRTAPSPGGLRVRPVIGALTVALAAFVAGWLLRPLLSRRDAPSFDRISRLTSGPARDFGPAISPDGKWVAYLSSARGPTDVWVRFVAGGEPANLTEKLSLSVENRSIIGGLDISPDGSLIAFGASAPGATSREYSTWVLPAPLGGVARKLIDRGRGARWSPDGTRIAFVHGGGGAGDGILVADGDGGNEREILRSGVHTHALAWSPDGSEIYFLRSLTNNEAPAGIWKIPSRGGTPEPVVASARRAIFPVPMPDGRGLLYASDQDSAELALWWRPLPRGAPVRLTLGVGEYAEPRVSRDGRAVVASLVDKRQALATVALSGGQAPRAWSGGYFGDLDPSASPRGDRLVWSYVRSGYRNLWIGAPDGSGARPLTSGDALDESPAFSADGSRVAFVSDRGGERGIWAVPSEGGAPRRLARAEALDSPTWSPDGKQILFAAPFEDSSALFLLSVEDGKVSRFPIPTGARAPAWNPREPVIAYFRAELRRGELASPKNRIAFVDPQGRPATPPVQNLSDDFPNGLLAWSADGRRLLAVARGAATRLRAHVVEPGAAEPYRLLFELPVGQTIRGASWSAGGASLLVGLEAPESDVVLLRAR